jgi:prepilin-type processing-associated H-X9-DG protein
MLKLALDVESRNVKRDLKIGYSGSQIAHPRFVGGAIQLRFGFTTLELLTTISIISVILSITVPAVMMARESSRRTSCLNNLRQLGIALQGFEATHRYLPFARETISKSNSRVSVQGQLLPYLEQSAILQKLESTKKWSPADLGLQPPVPVFLCPSDSNGAGLNYRVCTGSSPMMWTGESVTASNPQGKRRGANGAFPFHRIGRGETIAMVKDGLSNTMAMSERVRGNGNIDGFRPDTDIWFSGAMWLDPLLYAYDSDAVARICESLKSDPSPYFSPYAGQFYLEDSYANSAYNHVLPPNSLIVDCSMTEINPDRALRRDPPLMFPNGAMKASSRHSGRVVNALFLDGAATVVHHDVELSVWRDFATLTSELISDF